MGNTKVTICGWICVLLAAAALLWMLPGLSADLEMARTKREAGAALVLAFASRAAFLVAGLMMVRRLRGADWIVGMSIVLSLAASYFQLFRVLDPVKVHTLHYAAATLPLVWGIWLISLLRIPSVRSEFGLGSRRRRRHRSVVAPP